MPPSIRPIPDPLTDRPAPVVAGIGYHKPTNRYRIQYSHAGKWRNEYCPASPEGLEAAKRRRAELDAVPLRPVVDEADLARALVPGLNMIDFDNLEALDALDALDGRNPQEKILVTAPEGDGRWFEVNAD